MILQNKALLYYLSRRYGRSRLVLKTEYNDDGQSTQGETIRLYTDRFPLIQNDPYVK